MLPRIFKWTFTSLINYYINVENNNFILANFMWFALEYFCCSFIYSSSCWQLMMDFFCSLHLWNIYFSQQTLNDSLRNYFIYFSMPPPSRSTSNVLQLFCFSFPNEQPLNRNIQLVNFKLNISKNKLVVVSSFHTVTNTKNKEKVKNSCRVQTTLKVMIFLWFSLYTINCASKAFN